MNRVILLPGLEIEFNPVNRPFADFQVHGALHASFSLPTAAVENVLIDVEPSSKVQGEFVTGLKFALHSSWYVKDDRLDMLAGEGLCKAISDTLLTHGIITRSRVVVSFRDKLKYPIGGLFRNTKQGPRSIFLIK